MLKNITQLTCKVNEKDFLFLCDIDSPIDCCEAALKQFQQYIDAVRESVKMQQEENKIEELESPKEE